jgi:preprotein translocase subunit SecG
MSDTLFLVVHVVVCAIIVGLVMLQQGKGADAGASFGGGASQTFFGAPGSGNFLTRVTSILAAVFFVTSLTLAILARGKAVDDGQLPSGIPEAIEQSETPAMEKSLPELPPAEAADAEASVPVVETPEDAAPAVNATPSE